MGEIGISRREFYTLRWWEVQAILKGYGMRYRNMWSATRWLAYNFVASFSGSEALNEKGIYSPVDLLPLPWDQPRSEDDESAPPPPSADEVERIREIMRRENEEFEKKNQKSKEK